MQNTTTSSPAPAREVRFKHETEIDGQPAGPMTVTEVGANTARVYDPTAPRAPWVTLAQAQQTADDLGVPLREN